MNPVDYYKQAGAKVTSPYGMRKHPLTGKNTMHWGIDLDYPGPSRGRLWTSPYPGIVTHLGEHGARGKVAVVRIQGTRILQIMQHFDEFRCRVGDEIERGYPIGTNGTSGNVTGPHLHYELRWDNGTPLGSPVWGDPAKFTWEESMDIILINTQFDSQAGFWLQKRTKAPIVVRGLAAEALPKARKIYVVGGNVESVKALAPQATIVHLAGKNQQETMRTVLDFLDKI